MNFQLTTFVSWAAEAINRSLVTTRDGRRTGLLQANDVASETEAKITWMGSRDLFRGLIYFTIEHTC